LKSPSLSFTQFSINKSTTKGKENSSIHSIQSLSLSLSLSHTPNSRSRCYSTTPPHEKRTAVEHKKSLKEKPQTHTHIYIHTRREGNFSNISFATCCSIENSSPVLCPSFISSPPALFHSPQPLTPPRQ
jgi:hypothetical protein